MGTSDPAEEWRRLNVLYAEIGDTELLELRAEFGDLTEVAQGVLRDEMKKRQLWDLPAAADSLDVNGEDRETSGGIYADLHLGGVTVGEYNTIMRRS